MTFEPPLRNLSYLGVIQRIRPKTDFNILQVISLQHNSYNVTICNERMWVTKWSGIRYHYRDTNSIVTWVSCHTTSCNRFSVLSTFKFYIEISRDQISKHQKGALWAVTDNRFDSTRDVHYGTFRASGIFRNLYFESCSGITC